MNLVRELWLVSFLILTLIHRQPEFSVFAKKLNLKVKDKGDCSSSVSSMLSVPADTAEGLKEGTQPLQGLRGTDTGTLNNTLL